MHLPVAFLSAKELHRRRLTSFFAMVFYSLRSFLAGFFLFYSTLGSGRYMGSVFRDEISEKVQKRVRKGSEQHGRKHSSDAFVLFQHRTSSVGGNSCIHNSN